MRDCHANLFLGLTASNRFRAFVSHAVTLPSHHYFHAAWSPVSRGMGIFSEMICEKMLAVLMLSLRVDDTSGFPYWPKLVKSAGPLRIGNKFK